MHSNHTIPVTMEPMHNDLEHVFLAGSLSLIMVASLAGNIMVCITVYKKRRLRTRSNSFIINLALADLGVVTFCMPFSLVTCLSHVWSLGDVMCQLNGLLNVVFTQTSLLTLTAIAIDKYCAIVWPLKRVMTVRRTMLLLLWTWLQPVVIAVIPFAGLFKYQFKPGTTQCGPEFPRNFKQSIYGIFVCIIGYFIPLGILGYVYTKIFHSAKQSARRISRVSISSSTSTNSLSTHKKVAITVMILVALFLSCWTPYFVYVIIIISKPTLSTNTHIFALGKASYWMAFLCSALNPYIYGARNPAFRKEFKLLLCCMCPFLARPLKFKGCTIGSSKGSWGRMGALDNSNDFRGYNFAYAPQGRGGSLERTSSSNESNHGFIFTFAHNRDASCEAMGTANKSRRPHQYGFAYGSHYMGVKRKRSQGGWGHKKLSDSSLSEGNHDDTITELNKTSFNDGRHMRKASFLRFEDDLNIGLPKNDTRRTSSFYIDQGGDANVYDDGFFDQKMGNPHFCQNAGVGVVSKKSSFLERRNKKASLQLRFEDNTNPSLELPSSDIPFFSHSKKYSLEEHNNPTSSLQLRFEDHLGVKSPSSDVLFLDQRKSSFLDAKDVSGIFKKTSYEERHYPYRSQLLSEDDSNFNLESPTNSDAPLFNDRTNSFTNEIDEDEDVNSGTCRTSFNDQRTRKLSLKLRFEDDHSVASQTSNDVGIDGQRFRNYSNSIGRHSNDMRDESVERNRSHSSYFCHHGEVDFERIHGYSVNDKNYQARSHSNSSVLEGGLIDERQNSNINFDNHEDVRAELGSSPGNRNCRQENLINEHTSLANTCHIPKYLSNGNLSNHDNYNRRIGSNLVLRHSSVPGCHGEVNNNRTISHGNHGDSHSKQTGQRRVFHDNTALSEDNDTNCLGNRSSNIGSHGNSKIKQTEMHIGFNSDNTNVSTGLKKSADNCRRKLGRHGSQYKCRWIESTL